MKRKRVRGKRAVAAPRDPSAGRDEAGKFVAGNPHRFPAGVSGNPAGKPRTKPLSDAYLRELLRKANPELFTGRLRGRARKAVARLRHQLKADPSMADLIAGGMVLTAAREALAGRTKAVAVAEHLAIRTEGRVVTIAGEDGRPVEVKIVEGWERAERSSAEGGGGSGAERG